MWYYLTIKEWEDKGVYTFSKGITSKVNVIARLWFELTKMPQSSTHTHTHIYIYIYIYVVHSISFQSFFVQAFKIVVDSWKFTMLLLYILWDDWPILMISASNQQLQQQLEYYLLKPDCHSWWISKMQSGREEKLYAIKFCFKLGKMPPGKRMECLKLLLEHLAWIEHQFLSGIRDSRKAGSLREIIRSVGGVRKSIHQSWLAKGLRLGLLCWGFKGVQQEIPSEKANTLQIGSVAFPAGQWASRQFLILPIVKTLLPVTFGYSLSSEAVVMRQLRRWKRPWRKSLTHPLKRTFMGSSRSYWNGTTSALQPEEITWKGTRVSCVYYQEKCLNEKSLETYSMILVYIIKSCW